MAIYNEILVGRYARFLQKLFGIKGGVPAKQLAGEVMSVFPLFSGVEHRYLESWERFIFFIFQGGGAAQNAVVRLRNPVGSNVVAVIEKLMSANVGTQAAANQEQLWLSNATVDFTTLGVMTNIRLDLRGRPSPTCIASGQINLAAGVGSQVSAWATNVNTQYDVIAFEDQEITLLPGASLDIRNSTVNQALATTWIWRERFLEDSERA